MTPSAVQKAAATWLADVTGLSASSVIVGIVTPDIAVRLTKPFMTVTVTSILEIGDDPVGTVADETAVHGMREQRISLQTFGSGAMNTLELARQAVSKPSKMLDASVAGFEVVEIGAITPLMNQLDTGFEERATATLVARYVFTDTDADAGVIESAVVPGTLDPAPALTIESRAP